MFVRQRYQRRYPIRKIAGAQPQFNPSLRPEPVRLRRRPRQPLARRPQLTPVTSSRWQIWTSDASV